MEKEEQKPEGMTVHEALMNGNMQVFLGFLEKEAPRLAGLSFQEKTAEYLKSRGVPEDEIQSHFEMMERIEEGRARSKKEEAEARDRLIREGVIKPGQKLTLPATLIEGMRKLRGNSTY